MLVLFIEDPPKAKVKAERVSRIAALVMQHWVLQILALFALFLEAMTRQSPGRIAVACLRFSSDSLLLVCVGRV